MICILKAASTIALAALLASGLALAQTPNAEPAVKAAATTPVAYVYLGTAKGVDLYDAAPNGKLALVKGSPFNTTGLAVGSNGKYFISLGTYWVHAYPVSSTGTIGKQVSTINTQDYQYGTGECEGDTVGTAGLANLDHTGHNLYVAITVENGDCTTAIQTYKISNSGDLTFDGAILTPAYQELLQMPTIIGNDNLAYASFAPGFGNSFGWLAYARENDGELQNLTFNLSNDVTYPGTYGPIFVTADPTNHLAAIVIPNLGEYNFGPAQLASYTVESEGNLSSKATAATMPYPEVGDPSILNMSPSGKFLAVGGSGLQVFHFNGGDPITPYSKLLTPTNINNIHWDNSNHLYALSIAQNTSLLNFAATNATSVVITGSDGSYYDEGDCSTGCEESQNVSPTKTTTYTIEGIGANGAKSLATATVEVNSKPTTSAAKSNSNADTEPSVSISASPSSISTYSQLFVYTVTPTSITEAPGSPYAITTPGVDALVVVPK